MLPLDTQEDKLDLENTVQEGLTTRTKRRSKKQRREQKPPKRLEPQELDATPEALRAVPGAKENIPAGQHNEADARFSERSNRGFAAARASGISAFNLLLCPTPIGDQAAIQQLLASVRFMSNAAAGTSDVKGGKQETANLANANGVPGKLFRPADELPEASDTAQELRAIAQDVTKHTAVGLPTTQEEAISGAGQPLDTAAALEIATDLISPVEEAHSLLGAETRPAAPNIAGTLTTWEMCKKVHLQKYWNQRYHLWSKFDKGILMDPEGWYSATPEAIARAHAERLACDLALDAMCGVGGNAIQLAMTCRRVFAIDINIERLQLAKHNAVAYGVADRIDFICGDFFKLAPYMQVDAVFVSPPWGGPAYQAVGGNFQVDQDIGGLGIGFLQLLQISNSALQHPALQTKSTNSPEMRGGSQTEKGDREKDDNYLGKAPSSKGLAIYLPKSTSLLQLSEASEQAGVCCEVQQDILNDRMKAVTVFIGPLSARG